MPPPTSRSWARTGDHGTVQLPIACADHWPMPCTPERVDGRAGQRAARRLRGKGPSASILCRSIFVQLVCFGILKGGEPGRRSNGHTWNHPSNERVQVIGMIGTADLSDG